MISAIFKNFLKSEKTGGFILIFCTVCSLILANSSWGNLYIHFWNLSFQQHTITHWINDGLMAIFFLLIGLELKRELFVGELSNIKSALFPIVSAIGGVAIPALIFISFNYQTTFQRGAGIPMATDIAFAIGILSLLGKSVPTSLKIYLTALAVIDDLCAILVIAFFYSNNISTFYLTCSLTLFAALCILNKLKVNKLTPYIIGGIALWYCMLHSGVHATISGILLAFVIPLAEKTDNSISYKLQHALHYPVAIIIIPLFALANTCITINSNWKSDLTSMLSIGIITGLVIGKPLGILLFSRLSCILGLCKLPNGLTWKQIGAVSILAGIGFTMSIFITILAFDTNEIIEQCKIAIIVASAIASIIGLLALKIQLNK